MPDTIESVLRNLIAKQASIEPASITPASTLDELGVTSLDLVEIIMSIEDEYGVTIPLDANEASRTVRTFGDLINLGRSLGIEGA
jgi:acyl carrier protein